MFFSRTALQNSAASLILAIALSLQALPAARADTGVSQADQLKNELAAVGPAVFTSAGYRPGLIRHIVLFRYKSTVTAAQREQIKRAFLSLKTRSQRDGRPVVMSIETGAQNSGEGADRGLEQGFVVTFRSEGDRNYYVGSPLVSDRAFFDPAHDAFKRFVGPALEQGGVLVFDYRVEGRS